MPYAGVPDSATGDLDACVESVMAKGHDKSSAIAICRNSMNLSAINSMRWIEPFTYVTGQPFRVMPLGEYKRGGRTLNITADDLKAMAANYAAQRPRWAIPLYFGHPTEGNPDPPKVGNVKQLYFVDGDGLYAVPEFTPDGERAVAEGAYQFASPGVLWSKNGASYVDEQGKKWDNVIEHVALTNRPYFGASTQLFSADESLITENAMADNKSIPEKFMDMAGIQAMMDMLQKILALVTKDAQEDTAEQPEADPNTPQDPNAPQDMAAQPGPTVPKYLGPPEKIRPGYLGPPVPVKRPSFPSGVIMQNMPAKMGTYSQEKPTMDTEKFSITADEFAAVKAKADKADAMTAELAAIKTQADTFAADLAKERKSRRLDQLKDRAEKFMALPVKADELAEKFAALEEASPDLFHYFEGLLEAADKQALQAGLFSQVASGRRETNAETFDGLTAKVLADKFAGDPAKYEQAMKEAAALRPDLVTAYIGERE